MPFKQHHAWFLAPAWGHMTSANALIVRMLELNPELVITAVIHAMVGDKADANLAQYPNVAWERLKLVKAGDSEIGTLLGTAVMKTATAQLSEVWIEILKDACSGNQTWPKPTALIVDQAGSLATLLESKSIVGPNCQTLMHWTPSASCFYGFLAPSTEFGFSDWEETTDKYYNDETLRKGRSREQIQEQVCQAKNGSDELNGSVTKVPGVKDMYDYEREMGNCPSPPGLALMLGQMVNLSKQVNGIVITSSMAIEGPALEACSKYRKIYPVGIQIAPRGWAKGGLPIVDETLRIFLDKQGKQEVIFISFGSVFFPATAPQYVTIMLTVLEELNFPFVFLLGGIMASSAIPSEMISEINNRGIGFIYNKWLDQQAVLQHPSVGWFLTHGGWNSEGESLAQGVPMIGWPMAQSDQAINVALAATRDKPVAYELMQIRQGEAKAKAMRGGETITGNDESVKKEFIEVLTKARGEEGRVLRRNAEELGEELRVEKEGKADDVVRELAFI